MGWNGRFLTSPFTGDDLKNAVGASGYSADAYFSGADGYINPYSTYKPSKWSSADYGFDVNYIYSTDADEIFRLASSIGSWSSLYEYPAPLFVYRWDDFDGYDADAVEPFGYTITDNVKGLAIEQTVYTRTPSIDVSQMGIISDLGGSWEYAIIYRKVGSSSVSYAYGGGLGASESTIVQEFDEAGNYECVFIGTNGSDMIWLDGGYFEVTVEEISISLSVAVEEPMWNTDKTAISFSAIVVNNSTINAPVRTAVAKLRFLDNSFDAPMVAGEYEFDLNISSINAGQTITKQYNQTIPMLYRDMDYIVYVKVILESGVEEEAFEEVIINEEELS